MVVLDNLLIKSDRAKALAFALEGEIIGSDLYERDEGCKRVVDLFYQVQEQVDAINALVTELIGHEGVCDAVYAVNHVDELKKEIARLRAKLENANA